MSKQPPTGVKAEFETFIAMMQGINPRFSVSCCLVALANQHVEARSNRKPTPFPQLVALGDCDFSKLVGNYLSAQRTSAASQSVAA